MSDRRRLRHERTDLRSSDCRPDSLPAVLDLLFTSLQGRALPGSLHRQDTTVASHETSTPTVSSIDRDIWQSPSRPSSRRINGIARRLIGAVAASLRRWRERARDRQYLRGLSDRNLRDLGLSRAQVESDFSKSFWRE
jgi:uncharacterized protein YjiS (DUF1127 family)